ncbi:MAG: FKBP-type peptidyl-prolyl cis-trans isomerase [Pseudomonadota bacterium]
MNLQTDIEKASYLIGYMQGQQMKQNLEQQSQGVIDNDQLAAGVIDAMRSNESQVDTNQGQALMEALNTAVQGKLAEAQEDASAASADTIAAGDAYRAEYAAKEGVVTLPSGLLYEVINEGSGPKPTANDTVTTHYAGTLIDGTQFDSSIDRGQPASFPVGGVIAGWTEALQLMGVGSKWRLVIPPDLGYGERGSPPRIPPHSTLVFEVELLDIK